MNPAPQTSQEVLYTDEFVHLTPELLVLRCFYPWWGADKSIPLRSVRKIREVRLAIYNGLTWHEKAWLDLRWPHDWRVKGRKEGFLLLVDGFLAPIGTSCREPQVFGNHLRKILPDRF